MPHNPVSTFPGEGHSDFVVHTAETAEPDRTTSFYKALRRPMGVPSLLTRVGNSASFLRCHRRR